MRHSVALVTGTTSGLGYEAALALAEKGWREIIITGRSLARVRETAAKLATASKTQVFTPLELDLNNPSSVQSALAELVRWGRSIDFLLLNAGMVPGGNRVLTVAGIEESQAPLISHHQLTMGLLRANLLSPDARIVIAGSEAARGDVPMFSFTDVEFFAGKYHHGDRTAAIETLVRSGPNVKYNPNRAYADAKLFVAWWAAALARRLPAGMAVYAVSPGSAPDTQAVRNAGCFIRCMMPLIKLIPGMAQKPAVAARRYIQASEFGTDVSGQFFASKPKKMTGPMEAMRHPHFHDRENQEAAWKAIVRVSGVDLSYEADGVSGVDLSFESDSDSGVYLSSETDIEYS
jgi:NAD(P)-dependent dehydrogenase (short-subunit alcohol dehydrogenase family)